MRRAFPEKPPALAGGVITPNTGNNDDIAGRIVEQIDTLELDGDEEGLEDLIRILSDQLQIAGETLVLVEESNAQEGE